MKNKLVVANLKMNMDYEEVESYLEIVKKEVCSDDVVICPTSIFLPLFLNHDFKVGVQNLFYKSKGAYTGEVSPRQAKSIGVTHAILGHSERRLYFNETDEEIAKKVKEAIKYNLKVILCIGETETERSMLKTSIVLKRQLLNVINNLDADMFPNLIIAYEPIWAIGTGLVPTPDEISKTADYIRGILLSKTRYDVPILYGGSVDDKNIAMLNEIAEIDGVLVGGASTVPAKFLKIIEVVAQQ